MKIEFKKINTISNYISFLRLLLGIPIFILLDNVNESYSYRIIIAALCLFAFFTDLLDGYIARKLNQVSELGKIIDPLADKILVAIVIIKLFQINEIPTYYFWIIIFRDIIILAGGIFVSRKIGKVLPSNLLGKITVLSISLFILSVILNLKEHWIFYDSLLIISLVLSLSEII